MSALRIAVPVLLVGYALLWWRRPRARGRLARWARISVLTIATVAMLAPFLWLLAAAFKSRDAFSQHLFLPPPDTWSQTLTLDNFRTLFQGDVSVQGRVSFFRYLANSLFVSTVTTVAQLLFSSLGGYALAKFRFRGHGAMTSVLMVSFLVPGMLLVAPLYEITVSFGLIDGYAALIVPAAVSSYGILLFRQAFASVPDEIIEAGRVDGCSELMIFWRLAVPLVRPVSAAFCLVAFLASWNAYLGPNVMLQSQEKLTLPIVLSLYVAQHYNQFGVFLAGTLVAIVPPALLFLLLQRDFVRGLSTGAVKG